MAFSKTTRFKCPFSPSYLKREDSIPDLQKPAFQWLSLFLFAQKQEKKVQGAAVEDEYLCVPTPRTAWGTYLMASLIFLFSLTDVSVQPVKPFSLLNRSTWSRLTAQGDRSHWQKEEIEGNIINIPGIRTLLRYLWI